MKLDRKLQRELLTSLASRYPQSQQRGYDSPDIEPANASIIANLFYLREHGLIDATVTDYADGSFVLSQIRITAAGLDFLADDGGLTAILGVVTVKLHDETIRALISQKIEQSDLPPAEKKKWTDALRELPAESIEHLTMQLLNKGLENAPAALAAIGSALFGP